MTVNKNEVEIFRQECESKASSRRSPGVMRTQSPNGRRSTLYYLLLYLLSLCAYTRSPHGCKHVGFIAKYRGLDPYKFKHQRRLSQDSVPISGRHISHFLSHFLFSLVCSYYLCSRPKPSPRPLRVIAVSNHVQIN